jgi:hypothetical protein
MLLDRHHLDGIISAVFYSWQYLFCEFPVCTHPFRFLGHSNVAFINNRLLNVFDQVKPAVCPFKWFLRKPYLPGKIIGFRILLYFADVCGNPVYRPIVSNYIYFHFTAVNKTVFVFFIRKKYFPVSSIIFFQFMRRPVPSVKVTNQV